MISTNQSTVFRRIWTNERAPLCLPNEGEEELHDGPHRVLQQLRLLQGGEGVEVGDGLQLGQEGEQEELFLLLRDSQQV